MDRIKELQEKLAKRQNQSGMADNVRAIQEEIDRLQAKIDEADGANAGT